MRRMLVVLIACVLLSTADFAQTSDEQAVRAAVNQYLRGHATGDPAEMRKAFWPTAHIEGIREGKFVSWTVEEYASRFSGKPAADEASRTRTIDRVDVSGTAAMAGATLVHGSTTFTDYFVLLKVGGHLEDREQGLFVTPDEVRSDDDVVCRGADPCASGASRAESGCAARLRTTAVTRARA